MHLRGLALGSIAIVIAISSSSAAEQSGPLAPTDVYKFIAAIAGPTTQLKLRGSQDFERALTVSRNKAEEVVVTSVQILGTGRNPNLLPDTIAVVIAHYPGQCDSPYGEDDYAAKQGLEEFEIASSGRIWEVARVESIMSIRQVNNDGTFGPWEAFQENPANYKTYICKS